MYLLAILFPPLAILFCGKPIQFLLNIPLTILGWIPGMIHAIMVVNSCKADGRNEKLIRAIDRRSGYKAPKEYNGCLVFVTLIILICLLMGVYRRLFDNKKDNQQTHYVQ